MKSMLLGRIIIITAMPCVTNAVSSTSPTTTVRGRDECPSGANAAPLIELVGVGGPLKTTIVSLSSLRTVYGVGGPLRTTMWA